MTCKEVVDRLTEYWSNELEETAREKLAAHLKDCPFCQREWVLFQSAMNALRNTETPEPPSEILLEIRSMVKARQQRKLVPVWNWQWTVATAVFAFLILSVPIFQKARERFARSISPIIAEKTPPLRSSPALKPPFTIAPETSSSISALPTPQERIAKLHRQTVVERPESERAPRAIETLGLSVPGRYGKIAPLNVSDKGQKSEQGKRDVISETLFAKQTAPQIAQLLSEPRQVQFRTDLKLGEQLKAPTSKLTVESPISEVPAPQGSPEPSSGVLGGTPALKEQRSEIAERQSTSSGWHFAPQTREEGERAQSLLALRWQSFEPVVVGKVRLWELTMISELPQAVTVSVQPGEKIEVLNAQPATGEDRGSAILIDRLPVKGKIRIPILLRVAEPGARKMKLTIETEDEKTFSWWCVFAATEREERSEIRKLISLQLEEWTILDLLSNLAWEGKTAFLLPEAIAYRTINLPTRTMSVHEILRLLEQQLREKWLRFGNAPAFAIPAAK